jgi:hypothetical protein
MAVRRAFGSRYVPDNMHELFRLWLRKFSSSEKSSAMVGVAAVFRTLGKTRSSACFEIKKKL